MARDERQPEGSLFYRVGSFLVRISDTRPATLAFSAFVGIAAGVVEILAHDSLLANPDLSQVADVADAALVGLFVFLLTMVEVRAVRERRMRVLKDVETIGELNHHIRNALQAIQYSAYTSSQRSNIEVVNENVERVDRILRELFPALKTESAVLQKSARKRP